MVMPVSNELSPSAVLMAVLDAETTHEAVSEVCAAILDDLDIARAVLTLHNQLPGGGFADEIRGAVELGGARRLAALAVACRLGQEKGVPPAALIEGSRARSEEIARIAAMTDHAIGRHEMIDDLVVAAVLAETGATADEMGRAGIPLKVVRSV